MSFKNRGQVLERNVLQAAVYYEMRGEAVIVKMPTPVNIQKNVKGLVSGYLQKSTVDFYGTIQGGQAVYFDAKETGSGRFEMTNTKVMEPHQIKHLDLQHNMGALAFILLDFTAEKETYCIPWPVFLEYYEKAAALPKGARGKSLKIAECREDPRILSAPVQRGYLDFLAPFLSKGEIKK